MPALFVLIVLVLILANTIKILREWERGVVLRLGKFQAVRGPGITFLIPYGQIIRICLFSRGYAPLHVLAKLRIE